ncbi:hypothetical protein P7J65_04885 [Streptococcus suis]|uniref:hypothetical protein n=1 Tax=Streptococcus suis TaxID=1307 RepID=UPI0038B9A520
MNKFGIQTVRLLGPSKYIYVLCLDDEDNFRIREIEWSWLQDLIKRGQVVFRRYEEQLEGYDWYDVEGI